MAPKDKQDSTEDELLKILADLVTDEGTTDHLRVMIIRKIMESREGQSFFRTMFEEGISKGKCPECDHENYWLIPEDSLNELGWVTSKEDSRVTKHPTKEECEEFQESCMKKKVTF